MRIAITSPYCWPQVRRGSERFMVELADYLVSRGHDVTLISTHVGEAEERLEHGRRTILFSQRLRRFRNYRVLNPGHAFAFQLRALLRHEPFDWVHALSYHDAFGAALAKSDGEKFRLVMNHVGIPIRKYFRRIPHDYLVFRRALRGADTHVVTSAFAETMLERQFGYHARRLPIPVQLDRFPCKEAARELPVTVLFVGDANQDRKGALPTALAFNAIKQSHPDAVLQFSGHMSAERRRELLGVLHEDVHKDVQFLGLGALDDVPAQYRNATVTVLPAIWEAFGMVLVESLSSGTPVVGCGHAGLIDIVQDPGIGRLCDPGTERGVMDNIDGLVSAIRETIDLARDPNTASRCHHYARKFAWDTVGPEYEALYM